MSEATVRAKIKTVITAVTGIGAIHDYRRTSRSTTKILNLMKKSGVVNGWTISRVKMTARHDVNLGARKDHHFRISAIYKLVDATATEKTFQALLDLVFTAFLNDQTLGGLCIDTDPLQIDLIDVEEFGGTLYHVADCLLVCAERELHSFT